MESREEILANFQACTGIEDIGEALQHLENSNWVLVDAVNVAIPVQAAQQGVDPLAPVLPMNTEEPEPIFIPDDPPSFPPMMSSSSFPQMMPPLQDTFASYLNPDVAGGSRSTGVSLASDYLPLGASQRSRMLELNIEYRDRMIHLKVPDNQSIQVVKDLLLAETGVSPCQQEIRGWSANSMFPPSDRRLLSELNLPKENFLYLLTPEIPAVVAEPEPEEIIVLPSYTLTIIDLLHDKTYKLPFTGNQLVNHVKRDTSTVTGIPVFRQVWTGWPPTTQGENTLDECGIANNHTLTVNQSTPDPSMPIVIDEDGGSEEVESDDEYLDAPEHMDDDDIFVAQPSRSGIQPLLPDDFGDESLAGIKFGEEFTNRYGQPSLPFFQGSLDDALNESCNKASQDRKMLALYLHHDSSVLTNVFCTQVLCADPVIGMLGENFITWGWDLTFNSNKQRLLDMINRHFGSVAASTLRNFQIEKLPLVILVAKLRGNLEIFKIIHGNTTLDEFITELMSASESYSLQVGVERREEVERNERNYVKDEQERAFQEAQLADQVKERERADAEEEARHMEQLEEVKRRSEAEAKEAEEARRVVEQAAAQEVLPDEPAEDNPNPQANIRFRTPTETLNRRFLANQTLNTLLLYLASKGYRPADYKILSSWPRRDISVLSSESSLQELKLCPQETLTLEARHAQDSDSD